MKGKILVVYHHNRGYPLRTTSKDLLYSFEKYAPQVCYYINTAFGIPKYIRNINFDLVIFDTLFVYKRSRSHRFKKLLKRCEQLKKIQGRKIIVVQDEHIQTKSLNDFINSFNIEHVFSAAGRKEWDTIYTNINRQKVNLTTVLTGYLDDDTIERIKTYQSKKTIDIGYRASKGRYWLGEHGYMKQKIGTVVADHARKFNLTTDISLETKDAFLGDEWYKFLSKCKYTIGVESGTSIIDWEGKIEQAVLKYIMHNPNASFEESRQACFRNMDNKIHYAALAPRHLEACATRTCQLLVEGEYNGILKPMQHYIPIKKDFSNIEEVLKMVKEDKLRREIVENAYRDIVASGKYTYRAFVDTVLTKSMGEDHEWSEVTPEEYVWYRQTKTREHRLWKLIPVTSFAINGILSKLPKSWFLKLIKFSN